MVPEGGVLGARNVNFQEVRIEGTPSDGTTGGGLSEPNEGCAAVESRGMVVVGVRRSGMVRMGGLAHFRLISRVRVIGSDFRLICAIQDDETMLGAPWDRLGNVPEVSSQMDLGPRFRRI